MAETAGGGPARELLARVVTPHRPVLALILLTCLLYLPCVWLRDLWNPDEPRYAEVAREMVARGDYMLPHLNGAVYGEKPPLFFWLGILAGGLPGVPFESGTRLISTMAALGTLLLVFHLGRRLADAATGWLAALALATSSMFVVHASSGVIDGTLTFLVVAAIAVGLRAREESSTVLWALFYGLAGLAVITKGPVGLAIPAGVLLLAGLQGPGPRRVWSSHAAWGLLIVAAIAAAWLAPAISRGGADYARVILLKQNLGRAYQSWHHKEPLQFFLMVFPGSFLPWTLLLPTGLYGAWRRRATHPGARLALTWFVFTFAFFSVISGKKTRYLLPLFPAASLLVALELRALLPEATYPVTRWRHRLPIVLCCGLLVSCGAALAVSPFGPGARYVARLGGLAPDQQAGLLHYARFPGALWLLLPGLAVMSAGLAGIALLKRDGRAALACLMSGWVGLAGWGQWVGVPALNLVKSARPLAQTAAAAAGDNGQLVLYRTSYAGIFNVYTRRDSIPVLHGLGATASWLADNPGAVVLASAGNADRLRSMAPALETLDCRRLGDEAVCAMRAPAASGSGER